MGLTRFDNIGESATAATIAAYIAANKPTRRVHMTVLHNSGTAQSGDLGLGTVEAFHRYHVNTRGWKCIGYHFIIDVRGTIWAGRKMNELGAHAGPQGNPGSVGVCLVGNFDGADSPTEPQKTAFVALHRALHAQLYGDNPINVRYHREFMSTSCPGRHIGLVSQWFEDIPIEPEAEGTPAAIPVYVDGVHVDDGELHGNRTMIGLRRVLEAAGCKVDWNAKARTVHITTPGKEERP